MSPDFHITTFKHYKGVCMWVCVLNCFGHAWLWESMDCSPPGSSVHGILQARKLSGLPCPPPGDLPDPGIEFESLVSPALAGGLFTTSATWEGHGYCGWWLVIHSELECVIDTWKCIYLSGSFFHHKNMLLSILDNLRSYHSDKKYFTVRDSLLFSIHLTHVACIF